MEIIGENYRIRYDPETATIICQGLLRLYGAGGYVSMAEFEKSRESGQTEDSHGAIGGYSSILDLLNDVADQNPPKLTLDFQKLQSMNSAGINVFSKFVLKIRDQQSSQLTIQGARQFLWQPKVLNNLQKLMPGMLVEWK